MNASQEEQLMAKAAEVIREMQEEEGMSESEAVEHLMRQSAWILWKNDEGAMLLRP